MNRTLALAVREWPLLPVVAGVIVGQGCVWWLDSKALYLALPLLFLIFWNSRSRVLRRGVQGALLGVGSAAIAFGGEVAATLGPDQRYLGSVVSAVRAPQPGALSFTVLITDQVLVSNGSIRTQPLAHSVRVRCRAVDLPWRNSSQIEDGSRLVFHARFNAFHRTGNPFGYEATMIRAGILQQCRIRTLTVLETPAPGLFQSIARATRRAVEGIVGPSERAGLLLSMSIGTRDVLSLETERGFQRLGLTHLLVVSGYQVTLWYQVGIFFVLLCCGHSRRILLRWSGTVLAVIGGLGAALAFVGVIGAESSAIRAVVAMVIWGAGAVVCRGLGYCNLLLGTFLFLAVLWPGSYCDPGLQLTYAALIGLTLGAPRRIPIVGSRPARWYETGWAAAQSCVFASLLTGLLASLWFGEISVVGLALNPIVAPLLSLIGCFGGFVAIILAALGWELPVEIVSGVLMGFRDVVLLTSNYEWIVADRFSVVWWLLSLFAVALLIRGMRNHLPVGLELLRTRRS